MGTDFADIQEAQSGRREQQAAIDADLTTTSVFFQYNHPQLRYRSAVKAVGDARWRIAGSQITTRIDLQSQRSIDLGLRIEASAADGTP